MSLTSMANTSHHQGMNNSTSVDIRISDEKAFNSPERVGENPGPGSSRRDNQSRYTTEMSSKYRKEMDAEIANPGLKLDKYVIGKEFQTSDPRESFNRSHHGKIGQSHSSEMLNAFSEREFEDKVGQFQTVGNN